MSAIRIGRASRGNGVEGENVSLNVQQIDSIPQRLIGFVPGRLTVRGEVVDHSSAVADPRNVTTLANLIFTHNADYTPRV